MSTADKGTKTIEFWRWRHRTAKPGDVRRTMFQLTLDKTGAFPEARPIAGSKAAEENTVWPEFAETTPEVGRLGPE
jgi:hypothetical protein